MPRKNSRPRPPGEPDDRLLEEITGQRPPVDSFAVNRAPQPARAAAHTSVLRRGGGTGPTVGGQASQPTVETVGLIDFIFHRLNSWLDNFLEQMRGGNDNYAPAPATFAAAATRQGPSHFASPDLTLVTRLTGVTDLPVPAGLVYEPDLKRYFEQMRRYDYQTTRGGLAGLTCREVANFLLRGKWGEQFPIRFSQLEVKGPWPSESAYGRFMGMLPVYKAQANYFPSDRTLQKAIEDDISGFLRTGQGSVVFHPFAYK